VCECLRIGFAVRPAGRPMEYSSCSMPDPLTFRAVSEADVKSAEDDNDNRNENDDGLDNQVPDNDDASIIDDYFRLSDVTTTSGPVVREISRGGGYDADDSHWLQHQPTTTPTPVAASPPLAFTSGDEITRNRKCYDFVQSAANFVDLGVYGTSGLEPRPPPPCYPTKRDDEEVLLHPTETGRVNKFYTGSYSDVYFAQYGTGAFPVLINQGQYGGGGGGIATGGVLNDACQQTCHLTNGTTTGNGNSCGAGYLSVDVGGFGSSMLRPLGFQSSTPAWPPAFRQ